MAQIIKHRRGNLEGLKDATTRAGELLVVTGSSGLGTIANGADLVFVGIDGSTASPVNKILQGTTVPNLSGADYNTHVDGIPFFDTDDEKLYILNKGGNVEVKASPQTGGTGIVSGSSQVVLQSADKTGFTGASSITTLGTITAGVWNGTAIANANLANSSITIDGSAISLGGSVTTLQLGTSNSTALAGDTTTITGGQASAITANTAKVSNVSTDLSISGTSGARTIESSDGTNAIIPIATTSVSGLLSPGLFDEIDANTAKTGITSGQASAITANTAKVSATSSNVVSALSNQATDFGTGRVSGDDFGDSAGTSTFTGSFVGDGSGLTGLATNLTVDGDSGTQNVDLIADDLQFLGTANEIATAVTKVGNDVKVTLSLPDDVTIGNDLTVVGNLEVQGTTTSVDSTTVVLGDNILALNGSGAALGGLEVHDSNGPASGSLLWNGTTNQWIAGASGSESKVLVANGDGVFSGSAQVSGITNSQLAGSISNDKLAGSISNDKLAGSIANNKLANSSITIDGSAIALGGSVTTLQLGTSSTTALAGDTTTITGGQASAITANTAKNTNVSTDLSITGTTDARTIVSSDGTNAVIPVATTSVSGVMSKTIFDEHTANNAKVSNVSTNLSSTTATGQITINSSDGDNVVIGEATDAIAGLMSTTHHDKLDGIEAGADVTDATNVTAAGALMDSEVTNLADVKAFDTTDYLASSTTTISGAQASAITANTAKVSATSSNVVSALSNQATDFGTGRVSGDDFGNVAGDSTFTGSFVGDGSGLTGLATNLTVNTADVDLLADDLDIVGTANEIEVATAKVGNDVTVTIGLPDDVSIGNNLTVAGNLTVEGTTTTVDSTQVTIGDRIIELNYARNAGDAGLLVSDVDGSGTVSGSLLWDASADNWMAGALGSEKEIALLNASPTSNTVLKADSNGLLVDSLITDDGTNVTISGTAELRINAATANSFVYFDSNKSLESVSAATAGDVIQWNGSSFVASNEIDGGTF
jgi:hypothetical protein